MNCVEFFQAIKAMPAAREHLLLIKKQLKEVSYVTLIDQSSDTSSDRSIEVIVKSYFWACRLIKDCQCLPRSVALYQFLKASGHEVEHKFGVCKTNKDFNAHSWVEYKKQPLNESPLLKQRFKTLS